MPPEAFVNGSAGSEDTPPAASVCLQVIQKRADFLLAARARKQPMPGFLLQARDRRDDDPRVRVGFTASKKVGNAVMRNRAKRRLRALAREVLLPIAKPGWDYVLVARRDGTVGMGYADLGSDLTRAMERIHAPKPAAPRPR